MRYLVTNGYKHINKPDAIIITQPFNQLSFHVTDEKWLEVIGSKLPYIRNDTRISDEEIRRLKKDD
jgi:hypothetical protein